MLKTKIIVAMIVLLLVLGVVLVLPAVDTALAASTYINDDNSGLYYSGSWTYASNSGYYNNDQHYSNSTGAYVEYTFTGSSIQWIGPKNIDCGISNVYIDGTFVTSVDLYATSWLKQQVLYSNTALSGGQHTIRIMVTNTKNASSSGYYSSIDVLKYDTGTVILDDNDSAITYSSGWGTYADAPLYNGYAHHSISADAYCELTFTGSSIQWIGAINSSLGSADVYIDGNYKATVSQDLAPLTYQVASFKQTWDTSGTHTIRIVAIGPSVIVDAFQYDTTPAIPETELTLNDNNPSLSYSGSWTAYTDFPLYQGNAHYCSQTGSYCELTFNGTSIKWIGATNVGFGTANVYIDGALQATVDQNNTLTYQVACYEKTWSASGTHTIRIVANSNAPIIVDALISDIVVPSNAPRWNINTDDTNTTVSVYLNTIFIEKVSNTTRGWNWTYDPVIVPIISDVNGITPNWAYQDATVDTSSGTKVTLRFTSSNPNLEFKSIWWARPGAGPVEYKGTIENKTGSNVTYNDIDVVCADMDIEADGSVVLTRFNKSSDLRVSGHLGILQDTLTANQSINSTTHDVDDCGATQSLIPYHVFSSVSGHGIYFGYEWSFGKFTEGAGADSLNVKFKAYLWDSKSVTESNGKIFTVPAIYIGTYTGDLDNCGNGFKKWYWNYKVPATLRSNSNEPLLEYCVPDNEADVVSYFNNYDMASWGGELAKIDIGWLAGVDPSNAYTFFGNDAANWLSNTTKWPNGMTAGTIVHNNGQLLSLYMPHSFQWVDLATQAGRDAEKAALLARYDNYGFDYYRSDFWCENNGRDNLGPAAYQGGAFYLSHEGYMEVLDYMISVRPGFRYEHCDAGGTLKDFDTLQRVTVMTTEDSATPEGHRQAMYSCLYVINPVQLKADIAIQGGPGSPDDPAWVKYCLRTGFMGANMATSWGTFTSTMAAQAQIHWPLYTLYQRPILRGADVYHILPICDGVNWDGMEYYNATINKGSVLLFKPSANVSSSMYIKLKGLDRTANYTLTFQDGHGINGTYSGAALMDTGIYVTGMTGDYASEIIWINF